jgi:hypothetical protein
MKYFSHYAIHKKTISVSIERTDFPKPYPRKNNLLSREYCPFKDFKFNNGLPSTVPNIRDSVRPAAGEPKKHKK